MAIFLPSSRSYTRNPSRLCLFFAYEMSSCFFLSTWRRHSVTSKSLRRGLWVLQHRFGASARDDAVGVMAAYPLRRLPSADSFVANVDTA